MTCWFNAWLHNDAPNLGAALAASVARDVSPHRSPWNRLLRPLPTRMLSAEGRFRRRLVIASLVAVPLLLALIDLLRHDEQQDNPLTQVAEFLSYRGSLGIGATILVLAGVWSQLSTVASGAARFVADPAGEASRGSLNHVRDQLGAFIHQATDRDWPPRRLVVFVDDLERCEPVRAVEVCEKAHQLFGHRDVAIVLLADMRPLAAAAAAKHGVADTEYGELFLQKIVQVRFDLEEPEPPRTVRTWLTTFAQAGWHRASRATLRRPGRVGAGLLAVGFALLIGGAPFPEDSAMYQRLLPLGLVSALAGLALLVLAMVQAVVRTALRTRFRAASDEVDRRIQQTASGDETDGHDLAEQVIQQGVPGSDGLVQQRVNLYLADTSTARKLAQAELMRNPPLLPRNAKRVVNQLRVVLAVALRRGLLVPGTGITRAHIGRWVLLQERWPEVAQALVTRNGLGHDLEDATDEADLGRRLAVLDLRSTEPGLLDLLRAEPRLSPLLDRIVHYSG